MNLQATLPLVVCFVTFTATCEHHVLTSHVNITCCKPRSCNTDTEHRVSAKCDINGLNISELAGIQLTQHVSSLDLSSSGLSEIPRSFLDRFPNISYLSLANNSLKNMRPNTLVGLEELQTLDLSYTRVAKLGGELPNLENLFVKKAKVAKHLSWNDLLAFPKIHCVLGVSWVKSCDQCNISKSNEANRTLEPRVNSSRVRMSYFKGSSSDRDSGEICWRPVGSGWRIFYESPSRFLKPGYTLTCVCDRRDCITQSPLRSLMIVFRLVQRLLDFIYPLASVALVFNLTVIALISTCKELRNSPTTFLTLNMAVCDLFVALYCILTATFNKYLDSEGEIAAITYTEYMPDWKSFFVMCPYMTLLFGVTQFTSVMTSLLLTVERYFLIVYHAKPSIRISRKIAVLCVCTTWCAAVAYTMHGVFFIDKKQRQMHTMDNALLCSVFGHHVSVHGLKEPMPVSVFLGILYILVFLCTIPLYLKIYRVVRSSSNRVGVKREGELARRLAIVIFTNLLFSTIPLSLAPFFSNIAMQTYYYLFSKTASSYQAYVICSVWVPVLLLCLNSCLNPFLFAFRHHNFKRHLRQSVCTTLRCFRRKRKAAIGQRRDISNYHNTVEVEDTRL